MSDDEPLFDFDPRNAPAELLQAIGLVAMAAAQTESVVQHLIGALLGIDNIQTLALTAHMAAPLKDHVSRALAELAAPTLEELDQLDTILDNINTAYAKRNTVVHNALAIDQSGTVYSLGESARGSLQIELKPIVVDELRQDAALIYDAGMALQAFMIARGMDTAVRNRPIRAAPKRNPKAREGRRNGGVAGNTPDPG